MARDVWSVEDLNKISRFTSRLQDFLQELEAEEDVYLKDIAASIAESKREGAVNIGLITFGSPTDTLLQFEAGDYEIGLV